jgi:hypothetical protein
MGIQFHVDVEAQCVRLTCQGRYNKKATLNVFDQALEIAAQNGRKAALVDITAVQGAPPDLLDRFEIAVAFAENQNRKEKIVALVLVGEEPMIDSGRFGEIVATNRGALAKAFTDGDEAAAWLQSKIK